MYRVSDSAVCGATVSQRLDISECPGLARVHGDEDASDCGAAVSQRLDISECPGLARVHPDENQVSDQQGGMTNG